MLGRFDKASRKMIGQYFRGKRESIGISQSVLARELKLGCPQFVSNVERGISIYTPEQISKILLFLKLGDEEVKSFLANEVHQSFLRQWKKSVVALSEESYDKPH